MIAVMALSSDPPKDMNQKELNTVSMGVGICFSSTMRFTTCSISLSCICNGYPDPLKSS